MRRAADRGSLKTASPMKSGSQIAQLNITFIVVVVIINGGSIRGEKYPMLKDSYSNKHLQDSDLIWK